MQMMEKVVGAQDETTVDRVPQFNIFGSSSPVWKQITLFQFVGDICCEVIVQAVGIPESKRLIDSYPANVVLLLSPHLYLILRLHLPSMSRHLNNNNKHYHQQPSDWR
jgi:hypothetical protein